MAKLISKTVWMILVAVLVLGAGAGCSKRVGPEPSRCR